ncbi:hypothetical protein EV363DRAFT_1296676 [Boletus edulis]|nr:hypothetical protein EV363DRAFT_1296676 [Boletus edulis]
MAWGDHCASSDLHSTAQRSLPRLQRPLMKVISPLNVIMNPYGSDLSAAAMADQGSQGSEDKDDGDDDLEVLAEEFMRTCDDEEVNEEDRSCFTGTACPNGERPSPANQSQGSGARSSLPLWLTRLGPCRFTTIIESFHYHRFDLLQCFVPRAPYFGHFYDMLVEESAWESQQLIASLPADILKQDHSFKAIKRMGKTEGASTFNAIFTTVNQYAQDGWGPVLSAMLPSLASFGHGPPKVVFTDNIWADKEKLLSIFPSLAEGWLNLSPTFTSYIPPVQCLFEALPFAGQVDLAQMAREQGAAQLGVVGITTLCSNVLQNHLSQDLSICVSSTWGQAQLPASFINQATLDVYAVWAVYMALKTVNASQPVSSATPGGTPITMFAPDGRALAWGVIALD